MGVPQAIMGSVPLAHPDTMGQNGQARSVLIGYEIIMRICASTCKGLKG